MPEARREGSGLGADLRSLRHLTAGAGLGRTNAALRVALGAPDSFQSHGVPSCRNQVLRPHGQLVCKEEHGAQCRLIDAPLEQSDVGPIKVAIQSQRLLRPAILIPGMAQGLAEGNRHRVRLLFRGCRHPADIAGPPSIARRSILGLSKRRLLIFRVNPEKLPPHRTPPGFGITTHFGPARCPFGGSKIISRRPAGQSEFCERAQAVGFVLRKFNED